MNKKEAMQAMLDGKNVTHKSIRYKNKLGFISIGDGGYCTYHDGQGRGMNCNLNDFDNLGWEIYEPEKREKIEKLSVEIDNPDEATIAQKNTIVIINTINEINKMKAREK